MFVVFLLCDGFEVVFVLGYGGIPIEVFWISLIASICFAMTYFQISLSPLIRKEISTVEFLFFARLNDWRYFVLK